MAIPQDSRHIANQAGDFVPQHQNMWLLEIADLPGGDDKDLITLSLHSGAMPNESNEEVIIPYGNENRYVAGKAVYETMPLVIKDWVDRATRLALVNWRRQVYDPSTGNVGLPSEYKKTGELILQASNGTLLRRTRLIGLWPLSMEGGELTMEGAEQMLVTVTLRYDRPEYNF